MLVGVRDSGDKPTLDKVVSRISSGYKTVGQMVLEVLRECILTGIFAPGEHLRQEDLAERIGVSRIPVRTALMQLEAEGLVSFLPHRGAVVRTLTVEQVREVYEIRQLLETHALRKSVARMTSARAARLLELGTALDKQHEGGEFVDERIAFYRELYDAQENPTLVKMIEELRGTVGRYLLSLRIEHPVGGHRKLARYAARGDLDAAESHLRDHLDLVCKGIIAVMSEEVEETKTRSQRHKAASG
ncbi:MAG: FCD domain-containing protein [Streptosporangiales bacterium]|nr:FCD domain-containing protein [Streptosporangiales bacterium]